MSKPIIFLSSTRRSTNVIFCFNNIRSIFHIPEEIISSLSSNDIPMHRNNTFFFSCQWYRYLVALQNNLSFTNVEQHRYERTWSDFGREFDRFVEYIDRKLSVWHLNTNWQSIKHAQFEISQMIRPILEAIRNILRNIILSKDSPTNQAIELQPTALHRTASHCLSCKPNPSKVGKFWVIATLPHEIRNECFVYSCSFMQHRCSSQISTCTQYASRETLGVLSNASAEFSYFLRRIAHSKKEDPVLIGLTEMIDEERYIVTMQHFPMLNSELIGHLGKSSELH